MKVDWKARVEGILDELGWDWVSGEAESRDSNIIVKCENGHEFSRNIYSLMKGTACQDCTRLARENIATEMLDGAGAELLGGDFINKANLIKVKCKFGFVKEIPCRHLLKGTICNGCDGTSCIYGQKEKVNWYERFNGFLGNLGWIWISGEPKAGEGAVVVECNKGHRFEKKMANVMKYGFCSDCLAESRMAEAEKVVGEHGGKVIAGSATNKDNKIKIKCRYGQEADVMLRHILSPQENRCVTCDGLRCYYGTGNEEIRRKNWTKKVKEKCREKNFTLLTDDIYGESTEITVCCENGHVNKIRAETALYALSCKECLTESQRKYSIEEVNNLAAEKGWTYLSEQFKSVNEKVRWLCPNGHIVTKTTSLFEDCCFCPQCDKDNRAMDRLNEVKHIITNKGGVVWGEKPVYYNSRVAFTCSRGHNQKLRYHDLTNNCFCKTCTWIDSFVPIEVCQALAQSRGGECLAEVNRGGKLKWKCEHGHIWEATYQNIRAGKWCPKCRNVSQYMLSRIVGNILNVKPIFNCRSLEFMRSPKTGRILEIDIWVPEKKLAIEYDGPQHYKPTKFFGTATVEHAEKVHLSTVRNDKIKNALIEKTNEVQTFIRFRYDEPIEENYIREKLIEYGVEIPK